MDEYPIIYLYLQIIYFLSFTFLPTVNKKKNQIKIVHSGGSEVYRQTHRPNSGNADHHNLRLRLSEHHCTSILWAPISTATPTPPHTRAPPSLQTAPPVLFLPPSSSSAAPLSIFLLCNSQSHHINL